MSINLKRKMEFARAMATTKNIKNVKRNMELSKALAETSDMAVERSLPQVLNIPNRKKRVSSSSANSNISTSSTRGATINDNARDQVRLHEEPRVQHTSDSSSEETRDDIGGLANEKKGRGLTRGLNTRKYTRKCGQKPKIVIPKGVNRPVGEHSSKHATEIGVLIRLETPMQVEGWKKIPNEKKEDLFRKLVEKLTYELEEPHVVHCIWKSFAKQYSCFRSNAHNYYSKMKKEGGVSLARQRVYDKLITRPDDWLWLCDFWETAKFKKISETQSNNRDKLNNHHKLGTKSRAAHQFENSLDDIDMYEAEYRNGKNGWANEAVEANSAKMKALREEQRALPDGIDRMSTEQICVAVLGENSSYAKWKGLNRKLSRSDVISSCESSSSRARLEEELVSTQAELSNTKVELSTQKTTVEALVKCVENLTGKSLSEIINLPKW